MASRPSFRSRMVWRYCAVDTALTTTPASTRAVPVQSEKPVDFTAILGATVPSSRRKSPKRATRKTQAHPWPVPRHESTLESGNTFHRKVDPGYVAAGWFMR